MHVSLGSIIQLLVGFGLILQLQAAITTPRHDFDVYQSAHLQKRGKIYDTLLKIAPGLKKQPVVELPNAATYKDKAAKYGGLYFASEGRPMLEYEQKVNDNLYKAEVLQEERVAGIERVRSHKQSRAVYFQAFADTSKAKASKAGQRAAYWSLKADGNDAAAEEINLRKGRIARPIVHNADYYKSRAAEHHESAQNLLPFGPYFAQSEMNKQRHSLLKEEAVRSGDPHLARTLVDYYTAKAAHHDRFAAKMAQEAEKKRQQTKAWSQARKEAQKKLKARLAKKAIFPHPGSTASNIHQGVPEIYRGYGLSSREMSTPASVANQRGSNSGVSIEKGNRATRKGKEIMVIKEEDQPSTSGTKGELDRAGHLEKRASEKVTAERFNKKAARYNDLHDNAMNAALEAVLSSSGAEVNHQKYRTAREYQRKYEVAAFKAKALNEGDIESIRRVKEAKSRKAQDWKEQVNEWKEEMRRGGKQYHPEENHGEEYAMKMKKYKEHKALWTKVVQKAEKKRKSQLKKAVFVDPDSSGSPTTTVIQAADQTPALSERTSHLSKASQSDSNPSMTKAEYIRSLLFPKEVQVLMENSGYNGAGTGTQSKGKASMIQTNDIKSLSLHKRSLEDEIVSKFQSKGVQRRGCAHFALGTSLKRDARGMGDSSYGSSA